MVNVEYNGEEEGTSPPVSHAMLDHPKSHANGAMATNTTSSSSFAAAAPGPGSTRAFAEMLLGIVNDCDLSLSYVRRITMIGSLEQVSHDHDDDHDDNKVRQVLTEIVAEGILGSPTLSATEKDLIVRIGLIDQNWETIFARRSMYSRNAISRFCDKPFVNYRKMILSLLRSSQKLQRALKDDSWARLRAMILQTTSTTELDALLRRVLDRTCGSDIKNRILKDISSKRYYRLLLPNHLDCREQHEDTIMARQMRGEKNQTSLGEHVRDNGGASKFCFLDSSVYKRILLLEEHESIGSCPICLDAVHAPAVQLNCNHVFCGRCISDWLDQGSHHSASGKGCNCPVCRHPLTTGKATTR